MSPLLHRSSWRHLLGHPWQTVLAILGIAIGVAIVVAVDMANASARRAFALSIEHIAGRATHQIVGGPSGIDEVLYTRLRTAWGVRNAAPVVEGYVRVRGETLHLLGLDTFAEAPFRAAATRLEGPALAELLTEPDTLALPEGFARQHGIAAGSRIEATVGGATRELRVAGTLAAGPGQSGTAPTGIAVADIATAQELLGRVGRLDRIDLVLDAAEEAALRDRLPAGVTLLQAEARTHTLFELTRAFHTNLTAMSLLALVVGGFLIYNAMTFSVLQRRPTLANLRLLGVTRGEVLKLVLAEALVLGLAGTLLGLLAGYAIAHGLLRLVTRTINDLYFVLSVTGLHPTPAEWLTGLVLGLGVTLLAALGPALEAARTSPLLVQRRSRLEHASLRALPWLTAGGVLLALAGLLLARVPSSSLVLGFVALFLLIVGFSLLAPLGLVVFARWLTPMLGALFGGIGRLAARGVAAGLSRTGLAVAALAVAVSATVGVGVMIESFRASVSDWLRMTLPADLYVSAPSEVSSRVAGTLDARVPERIAAVPGVAEVSLGRRVVVESRQTPVEILTIHMASGSYAGFRFFAGDPAQIWRAYDTEDAVIISEPLAKHRGLRAGDELELLTDRGWRRLRIAGVFQDYAATEGYVVMRRSLYERLWDDRRVSAMGVFVDGSSSAEAVREGIVQALRDIDQAILVRSNAEIRAVSLEIFDRTFAITHVLRLLVIGVAFVGVLSALLALQLEKAREHAILRATGVTPRQLVGLVSLQTALLGLSAGLIALPLGLVMARVLIDVINLRAFGWSMQALVPLDVLSEAVLLAVGSALIAGLYPAWRMTRIPSAQALREE